MRFASLVFFAPLLFARAASAGELAYEAPSGCPPAEDVAARAAARAPTSRDARMSVQTTADGYRAHLSIGAGEDVLERDVQGRTCAGVVEAALLVLSLDEAPAPPPVAAATVVPTPDAPTAVAPASETRRAPIAVGIGLDGQVRQLSYATVAGATIFGELGAPEAFGWRRYRPSVRLGGAFAFAADGSDARFGGATLNVCPLGVAVVPTFTLGACGVLDVGGVHDTFSGAWFDAGGVARATLQIERRWFIDLGAGLVTRFGENTGSAPTVVSSSRSSGGFLYVAGRGAMTVLALGGGVVFP